MEEAKIITKLKQHDESVLDLLINKYSGYVFSIVRNIAGSSLQKEDIEELVIDTFATIWKNCDNIDETRPLKPYLIAVARNNAKNRLRTLSRHAKPSEPIDEIEIPYEENITLEKEEQIRIIKSTLINMDSDEREIFIRYYYEYEKIQSIADSMGLTESAIKMKLHRTRKVLRAALLERGYLNAD